MNVNAGLKTMLAPARLTLSPAGNAIIQRLRSHTNGVSALAFVFVHARYVCLYVLVHAMHDSDGAISLRSASGRAISLETQQVSTEATTFGGHKSRIVGCYLTVFAVVVATRQCRCTEAAKVRAGRCRMFTRTHKRRRGLHVLECALFSVLPRYPTAAPEWHSNQLMPFTRAGGMRCQTLGSGTAA
jgi:hypothetical protein